LSESDELIAIRPAVADDPPIILTDGQEQAVAWIATLGILQVVLVAGLVVYQLRRKYE
jgi:predicted cation transporter